MSQTNCPLQARGNDCNVNCNAPLSWLQHGDDRGDSQTDGFVGCLIHDAVSVVLAHFCGVVIRACVHQLNYKTTHSMYRKIPRIRPPFDALKLMPKMGGGLIREDLTFDINDQ